MRTEAEVMDIILGIARADERIRAAYMNGSRVNPAADKDIYRDYDIVYVVTETASFIENMQWLKQFGELLLLQEPDRNDTAFGGKFGGAHDFSLRYAWLMLFADGTRIDLGIETKESMLEGFGSDTLTVILLDKDGILPEIPPPGDSGYHIKPPDAEKFAACCNNFWWCQGNVAKGIARGQLPYAMRMYGEVVRSDLDMMIDWYIGVENNFAVNTGKWGKYFERYLPEKLYAMYLKTYSSGDYEQLWAAMQAAGDLFHTLAHGTAQHLGFEYRQDEEDAMRRHIQMITRFIKMPRRQKPPA